MRLLPVNREMGAVVNTVKVLQSKAENLVDTYLLLMPAGSQNVQQFSHVCEMKALTKKQQVGVGGCELQRISEPA